MKHLSAPVLIHEIGHALGIGANAYYIDDDEEGAPILAFTNGFNRWSAHLRDDNDKAAAPNQIILDAIFALYRPKSSDWIHSMSGKIRPILPVRM